MRAELYEQPCLCVSLESGGVDEIHAPEQRSLLSPEFRRAQTSISADAALRTIDAEGPVQIDVTYPDHCPHVEREVCLRSLRA